MSKCPMRGHFRYLRFKTFPMTLRTPPMQGVLGPAVELWTFGSPGGLQIPNFSKCWASPPHLAKVGLRHYFYFIKQCFALNGHLLLVLLQCLASTTVSPSLRDFELVLEPLSLFSSLLQLPLLQPHHYWLGH